MNERCQMILVAAGFLLMICLIASVTRCRSGTYLERASGWRRFIFRCTVFHRWFNSICRGQPDTGPFVDGEKRWGGLSGTYATMSADGSRIISAVDNSLRVFDDNGQEIWTRNEGGQFRAVAISGDGSLIVGADNNGYIHSYK